MMTNCRNSGNVELALCNDSDCSERTSSDRTFNDYDMAIVNRLQYLTQRVEDLERKLEKRMPIQSDDLSFALSVNNNNSVPNVDIKVLSGPREPYYNSTGDEDLMSGWDDGIVERNTSFLIIPVGDDKDFQLNEAQRLKQTLDGTLEPTTSLPALCYADTHNNEIMDADEDEESLEVNNFHTTPFMTTHRAISVSNIIPSGNFTNQGNIIESEQIESTSDSSPVKSNECSSDDIKVSRSEEQKVDNKQVAEEEPSDEQQNMEKMVKHMEKFDTTSRGESPRVDGTLRYGYTISVAGVNPQKQEHRTKTLPFQPRVFYFENDSEKDITPGRRDSGNTIISQDFASVGGNKSTTPRYVVRSTVLPKSENVCYEDAGIDEVAYQRHDNEPDRLNGNDDICDDDTPIRIDPGLSKHDVFNQNFVKSHTCNSHSIEKQLKNAESLITGPQGSGTEHESAMNSSNRENMSLFDDVVIEKEVEEITNRVHRTMGTMGNRSDEEDEKIQMQIERRDRLSRCKDFDCPGNGSDDAYMLSNNTTADGGLVNYNTKHNTSSLKEIAVDCFGVNDLQNNPLYKNTRHRCASNKTALRKMRVRSLELPLTSSEEDLSLTMIGDIGLGSNPRTTRPQRKKQRNKTAKPTLAARNNMACQEPMRNLERKLKELIDPGEIGNLQEEIAAVNRPLLLAVMSPTDSGYIGSNADSPRDAWKDHYYESPYCGQPSTPVNQYSSPKERHDPVPKEMPARMERQDEVHLSPRSAHHSVGSHSSASSTVSYLGGSDYSEISAYGDDRGAYPDPTVPPLRIRDPEISRLSEYFPGPSRIPFDNYSSTVRLNEYLLNRHAIASPTSSVGTSDLSDSFFGCESDYCECQTGIATEHDFRKELKSISRYVLEAGEKTEVMKKTSKPLKRYFLDEEQGEMDIFGARLQKDEHKAVPILVKVILRLRKHFFGGIEGPKSLKSLSPRQEKGSIESGSRARKISFSPSAMLLSAVGESSASEIRDVIEKDRLDVNQLSPSGKSLLHKAAASGDLESIHTLIEYGAKVNLTDQDGFAPVHSALRRCHYKCAIFLIECGTDMAAYTRTRIEEISMIKNMSSDYMRSVLNTPL